MPQAATLTAAMWLSFLCIVRHYGVNKQYLRSSPRIRPVRIIHGSSAVFSPPTTHKVIPWNVSAQTKLLEGWKTFLFKGHRSFVEDKKKKNSPNHSLLFRNRPKFKHKALIKDVLHATKVFLKLLHYRMIRGLYTCRLVTTPKRTKFFGKCMFPSSAGKVPTSQMNPIQRKILKPRITNQGFNLPYCFFF